jgi:hypothetical protein
MAHQRSNSSDGFAIDNGEKSPLFVSQPHLIRDVGDSGDDNDFRVYDSAASKPISAATTARRSMPCTKNEASSSVASTFSAHDVVDFNVLLGLTMAGMAASLLTTMFGMFHVKLFLTAYQLPLATYSIGNVIYSLVNTANDVAGAWLVDQAATVVRADRTTVRKRSDLIGGTGCVFALCFLVPFFRPWTNLDRNTSMRRWWDGLHFVVSVSLYDTMYSFAMILHSSIVMNDHEMSDVKRIRFLALCKGTNLLVSLAVARLGLYLFDPQNLTIFRLFLLALAALVGCLSMLAQRCISEPTTARCATFPLRNRIEREKPSDGNSTVECLESSKFHPIKCRPLEWRRVVSDFWRHDNFRAWIGMEMLLEAQTTFLVFFRQTFFDRLVHTNADDGTGGVDKDTSDWILSTIGPMKALISLLIFLPIQRFGYAQVYRYVFVANLVLALFMLVCATEHSTSWIVAFLIVYPVLLSSIQSAGFALAMADMVLEMKFKHAVSNRWDEPSLVGLFMGANALMCKPMESLLPIVAAQAMMSANAAQVQRNLFYVLVLPPLLFSGLQLLAWKNYDLSILRTNQLRKELQSLVKKQAKLSS